RALAASLPEGGTMMLVAAGAEPSVRAPLTDQRAPLEAAIAALRVQGVPRGVPSVRGLEESVALAAERLEGSPAPRIVLLTDAAADGEARLAAGDVALDVRRLGSARAENAAILDAAARPARPAPGEPRDRDLAELFARVRWIGSAPRDVFLEARLVGGDAPFASRRLTLHPDEDQRVVLRARLPPDARGRAAVVELALRTPEGADLGDALDLDDRAVVPSPGVRRLPVFLVGPVAPAFARAFAADPDVELFRTDLERLAALDADERPVLEGLVVFAGALPAVPPAGLSIVVAPEGNRAFEVSLGETREAPAILTWAEDAEALRFTSFEDVHLAAVRPLGGAGRTLLETSAGAAMREVTRPDGVTLVLGFDPAASDWTRDPSFVIFARNALERARRSRAAGGIAAGPLGAPLRVPAPDGSRVLVESPGGERADAVARAGVALVAVPALSGVHRATLDDGRERFALRALFDAGESDPRPRLTFAQADTAPAEEARAAPRVSEAWPWLAAVSLVLLVLEALWATRREARA
ncbi:MAG: hypothetical protein AAGH15_24270, partial [Myxococcota bacterium]